jgi:hypothetical protein
LRFGELVTAENGEFVTAIDNSEFKTIFTLKRELLSSKTELFYLEQVIQKPAVYSMIKSF